LITLISLVVLLTSAFLVYVSDYYRADDVAIAVMQSAEAMRIQDNFDHTTPLPRPAIPH